MGGEPVGVIIRFILSQRTGMSLYWNRNSSDPIILWNELTITFMDALLARKASVFHVKMIVLEKHMCN